MSKKPMKRQMVLSSLFASLKDQNPLKDITWEEVPYTCTRCQKEIETWEDLSYRRLPCGCRQEVCSKCVES